MALIRPTTPTTAPKAKAASESEREPELEPEPKAEPKLESEPTTNSLSEPVLTRYMLLTKVVNNNSEVVFELGEIVWIPRREGEAFVGTVTVEPRPVTPEEIRALEEAAKGKKKKKDKQKAGAALAPA